MKRYQFWMLSGLLLVLCTNTETIGYMKCVWAVFACVAMVTALYWSMNEP